jgi:SAM-dependent methyltransferase
MSEWTSESNAMLEYYDADFPSGEHGLFPENFDAVTEYQGLARDVDRYRELARETGGPILEIGCGTGRVALALSRAGFEVTGVDFSRPLLAQLGENARRGGGKVDVVEMDATRLDLGERRYRLAILAFNSLACIPDFDGQRAVLAGVARHLAPGGVLAVDMVNPLVLDRDGNAVPRPFFTRRHPRTGRTYTRFAMTGPMDAQHRQRLYGYYDELSEAGAVTRRTYETFWRPVGRYELELMLREAGLFVRAVEGGHGKERYTASSPRAFVTASRDA